VACTTSDAQPSGTQTTAVWFGGSVGATAHASEAGDALVTHPGLVGGPIPIKEGHRA
jgi:hypothetical protein